MTKLQKKENPPFPKSTPFIHLPHSKNKCIQMIWKTTLEVFFFLSCFKDFRILYSLLSTRLGFNLQNWFLKPCTKRCFLFWKKKPPHTVQFYKEEICVFFFSLFLNLAGMSWPKWMCKLFFCNSAKTMHAKGVLFKSPWQHLKTKHKLRNRIQRYTNAAWFFFLLFANASKKKKKNRCHWKYSERNQRLLVMPIYLHAQHRMHEKIIKISFTEYPYTRQSLVTKFSNPFKSNV